jgi:transposase
VYRARRHLLESGTALYDVGSSYYEGHHCPLAKFGHNRDGKKGKPIIVSRVLTDERGCPVLVQVYSSNTADPVTVPDQLMKIRESYGLSQVVLVGDRGMLTQPQIDKLKEHPGLGWITALRSSSIRQLVQQGTIQMSLFDQPNLAEVASPDYPGERLVVCYNPLLADENFVLQRNEDSIRQEAGLDGIYVIRTSQPKEILAAEDAVHDYKRLSQVERVFRCLKSEDLRIRPILHRTDPRVRAHIFLCLLAYYVEWHLRQAWTPLLFAGEKLN